MKNTHFIKTNPRTGNAQQDNVGDCVTRAIVNAFELDYKKVYDELSEGCRRLMQRGYILKESDNCSPKWVGKRYYPPFTSITARSGVNHRVYRPVIKKHGMKYLDLDFLPRVIPFNCDVLSKFPKGTFIVEIDKPIGSGHITCIKDNVIYDSWDCATSEKKKYHIRGIYYHISKLNPTLLSMKDIVKSYLNNEENEF